MNYRAMAEELRAIRYEFITDKGERLIRDMERAWDKYLIPDGTYRITRDLPIDRGEIKYVIPAGTYRITRDLPIARGAHVTGTVVDGKKMTEIIAPWLNPFVPYPGKYVPIDYFDQPFKWNDNDNRWGNDRQLDRTSFTEGLDNDHHQ